MPVAQLLCALNPSRGATSSACHAQPACSPGVVIIDIQVISVQKKSAPRKQALEGQLTDAGNTLHVIHREVHGDLCGIRKAAVLRNARQQGSVMPGGVGMISHRLSQKCLHSFVTK